MKIDSAFDRCFECVGVVIEFIILHRKSRSGIFTMRAPSNFIRLAK